MNATRIALFTGAVAMAAAGAAHSAAHSAPPAIKFDLSGHINITYMNADDGNTSENFIVDNGASQTRMRVKGSGDIGGGLKAGGVVEFGISALDGSGSVTLANRNTGANEINLRHTYVFFGGDFGTVTVGKTDGAADGASEHDFSGTSLTAGFSAADIGGGVLFQNNGSNLIFDTDGDNDTDGLNNTVTPATSNGSDTISVGNAYGLNDFEGRHNLIRYTSPTFGGGMTAGVSYGHKDNEDVIDLGINGNFKLAGGDLKAGIGYSDQSVVGDDTQIAGSVAFKMPSGFNMAVRYDDRDNNNRNTSTYNIKLGYIVGPHSMSIGYGEASDRVADGVDASVLSLGYHYDLATNVELYAGYNNFSLDGVTADDVRIIAAGTRVKF